MGPGPADIGPGPDIEPPIGPGALPSAAGGCIPPGCIPPGIDICGGDICGGLELFEAVELPPPELPQLVIAHATRPISTSDKRFIALPRFTKKRGAAGTQNRSCQRVSPPALLG